MKADNKIQKFIYTISISIVRSKQNNDNDEQFDSRQKAPNLYI